MRKRFLKVLAAAAVTFVVLILGVAIWVRGQLTGSLPKLDGEIAKQDVAAPVTIERDALGIPTIRAENRMDAAYALGFVHGQDRFFQMDLLRRNSAGELAEIIGPAVVKTDRKVRVHRFRDVARRVLSEGSEEDRSLLEARGLGRLLH